MTPEAKSHSKRLLALDVLRGITIAGMILVNNPGDGSDSYAPLRHAEWNGLTPTDLVFPFFMFIMGVSTYFSLRKFDFRFTAKCVRKILVRTAVIFAIGLGITWLALFLKELPAKDFWDAACNFDHIRVLGVLPRLALCYGIGSFIALCVGRKSLPWLIFGMLSLYAVLLIIGNGYAFDDSNILYRVDSTVLGDEHLHRTTVGGLRRAFDPEGLLSTLPSVAHMLIGFMCGGLIVSTADNNLRINKLFIVGTILTFGGFLLSYGLPLNKRIWSPTFVLTTCGLASLFLGLLIWIIDIKGWKRWTTFFNVFGVNPLFMYTLSEVVAIVLGGIPVSYRGEEISLYSCIHNAVWVPLAGGYNTLASLFFALAFVVLIWIPGYFLYKNKIYIKI